MRKFILNCGLTVLLCVLSFTARAQLVTVDDSFGVPVFQTLVTESPGVLKNDIYDGEPAEDGGATAVLLISVLFGTLECASNAELELCPDGSFNYTPGLGFGGSDSFTYRATVGAETADAVVSLTACEGGPVVFVCRRNQSTWPGWPTSVTARFRRGLKMMWSGHQHAHP